MYNDEKRVKIFASFSLTSVLAFIYSLILPFTTLCSGYIYYNNTTSNYSISFNGYKIFEKLFSGRFYIDDILTIDSLSLFALVLGAIFFLFSFFGWPKDMKLSILDKGFFIFSFASFLYLVNGLMAFNNFYFDLYSKTLHTGGIYSWFCDFYIYFAISLVIIILYIVLRVINNKMKT